MAAGIDAVVFLLRGLDELGIALKQLIDELIDLDVLGLARGDIVAHQGMELDRQF